MLINLTNHLYRNWPLKQQAAARQYGEVTDLPFPEISADISEGELQKCGREYLLKIRALKPDAVLVMGEFSLVFMLVDALLEEGIPVLCAASDRAAEEKRNPDGTISKNSRFDFVRFREYRRMK